MIAEIYQLMKANGSCELGYTFKNESGDDDSLFDIPVITIHDEKDMDSALAKVKAFRKTARMVARTRNHRRFGDGR